ncbi:MAG: hypothetical protein ACLP8S_15155 [Solirubrobacteraceae bacterium]
MMDEVAKLPPEAWSAVRLERPGKHRNVSVAEMTATIAKREFRQLAVKGLGRDQPTLLLTNQRELTAKALIERYAKRWAIENKLAAQIRAFHLNALASQVPLAVDLDTTLSVLCDSIYRKLALRLGNDYQTDDHPRHHLPPLHRRPRRTSIHPQRHQRRPPRPRAHPDPARRRLRQADHQDPMVGRPPTQLQLPARIKLKTEKTRKAGSKTRTGNPG